jgi:hypothetical protein
VNYFAHGRDFVDDPYFLAGTAVPDWLSVVDRKVRAKSRLAERYLDHPDARMASLAAGIVRHHQDDRWFHQTRAFAELSLQFTVAIRNILPADDGFRPSFLGHILVEILLDAVLVEQEPQQLDAYYAAMQTVDPQVVGDAVNRMATRPSSLLSAFIPRFCAARFLYDYLQDEKLLWRLNLVMRRVRLAELPHAFLEVLPPARQSVRQRQRELLAPSP